jgi:hypothetical protein
LLFEKNANFSPKIVKKSQKIVIITSVPEVALAKSTDLFRELLSPDFDEGGGHGLHVRLGVVERHAAGPDGVLVLVGVDA